MAIGMKTFPILLASALSATGCAPAASPPESASTHLLPATASAAEAGRELAAANCASCHAITARTLSSNPMAPPFEGIANMPMLTADTLKRFLEDSHSFPDAMNFRVDARGADELTAYILTLKSKDYRPGI